MGGLAGGGAGVGDASATATHHSPAQARDHLNTGK